MLKILWKVLEESQYKFPLSVFQFLETVRSKMISLVILLISFAVYVYYYVKGYIPDKNTLAFKALASTIILVVFCGYVYVNYDVACSKVCTIKLEGKTVHWQKQTLFVLRLQLFYVPFGLSACSQISIGFSGFPKM